MKSLLKTLIISLSLLITSSVIADSNSRSHDVTEYVEVPVSKFRLVHEHPNEHPNEHPSVPPPPSLVHDLNNSSAEGLRQDPGAMGGEAANTVDGGWSAQTSRLTSEGEPSESNPSLLPPHQQKP